MPCSSSVACSRRRMDAHQDLLRPLQLPMDACGWASAYWVAAQPRKQLVGARACSRPRPTGRQPKEPSKLLSTLLWTHGCNAYAFARANDEEGYASTVSAFSYDIGAADIAAASGMPADDYPPGDELWQAAAILMGDESQSLHWISSRIRAAIRWHRSHARIVHGPLSPAAVANCKCEVECDVLPSYG